MSKTMMTRPALALMMVFCAGAANAASSCTASYVTRNDWSTGFVADMVITNTGAAAVSGWKVSMNFNAPVTLASTPWGANVAVNGNNVTSTDNGSRPGIAPGATVSYGMALSFAGAKPTPGTITVSGVNCVETAVNPALYVDPESTAAIWTRNNPADGRAADIGNRIANQPGARWFGGWSGEIGAAVGNYVGTASYYGRTPILVAYNIPARDCGLHSAGGAASMQVYRDWIRAFATAVGTRPAIVILEPDALPQLDCLDAAGKSARLELFRYAVGQFSALAPRAYLYLDIGNSAWLAPEEAATRLVDAGIAGARGFALNVSNYRTDAESNPYGVALSNALRNRGMSKTFVVDTSRNGKGPDGKKWCDPAGRKLGVAPRVNPAGSAPEMTLWIKSPGESDGCAGPAGTFVPDLAYKMIYGY